MIRGLSRLCGIRSEFYHAYTFWIFPPTCVFEFVLFVKILLREVFASKTSKTLDFAAFEALILDLNSARQRAECSPLTTKWLYTRLSCCFDGGYFDQEISSTLTGFVETHERWGVVQIKATVIMIKTIHMISISLAWQYRFRFIYCMWFKDTKWLMTEC